MLRGYLMSLPQARQTIINRYRLTKIPCPTLFCTYRVSHISCQRWTDLNGLDSACHIKILTYLAMVKAHCELKRS